MTWGSSLIDLIPFQLLFQRTGKVMSERLLEGLERVRAMVVEEGANRAQTPGRKLTREDFSSLDVEGRVEPGTAYIDVWALVSLHRVEVQLPRSY